jgi:hypothetical protein
MKIFRTVLLLVATSLWSLSLAADTREVSNTSYNVNVEDGEQITTPAGNQLTIGAGNHGSVQDEVTGESFSRWCTGESSQGEGGQMGAGYCTLIADNGNVIWVSYVLHGAEPSTWTVMGGTGQYEGASGSGTTMVVSQRADGQAWTSKDTGTLTTK